MPRLYFHTHNGTGAVPDDEGIEVADEAAAFRVAVENIRSLVGEEARHGLIDLGGHIDVSDEQGRLLLLVSFVEAFELRLPDDGVEYGS